MTHGVEYPRAESSGTRSALDDPSRLDDFVRHQHPSANLDPTTQGSSPSVILAQARTNTLFAKCFLTGRMTLFTRAVLGDDYAATEAVGRCIGELEEPSSGYEPATRGPVASGSDPQVEKPPTIALHIGRVKLNSAHHRPVQVGAHRRLTRALRGPIINRSTSSVLREGVAATRAPSGR